MIESDPYRTHHGKLRSMCHKAIHWYCIDRALKPQAASAYPVFYFKNRDGQEVTANIGDIVESYEKFKKNTHGLAAKAA